MDFSIPASFLWSGIVAGPITLYRGDIFLGDEDRKPFPETLTKACARTDW